MKKTFSILLIIICVTLFGCEQTSEPTDETTDDITTQSSAYGDMDEQDRTINANADIVCVAEKYTKQLGEIMNIDNILEMSEEEIIATREKSQELNKKMKDDIDKVIAEYGFADKDAFDDATARYFTNDEIDRQAKDLVFEKCGLNLDEIMEETESME